MARIKTVEWCSSFPVPYPHFNSTLDSDRTFTYFYRMLLNRVINMFKWGNVPDTINVDIMNMYLIMNGKVCITDFNEKLYACFGNYGGQPDEYYNPTIFTIANPVLGSKQVKIDETGVVIFNSTVDIAPVITNGGLSDLLTYSAQLLTDSLISVHSALLNSRVALIFTAMDDTQKTTCEEILKQLYSGDPALILSDDLINKLQIITNNLNNIGGILQQICETYQFILAQFYHSIGVNSNYNMKRERLNTAEVNTNESPLMINIKNMLEQRKIGVEKVNAMYGTNITVDLSEEWKQSENKITEKEGDRNDLENGEGMGNSIPENSRDI